MPLPAGALRQQPSERALPPHLVLKGRPAVWCSRLSEGLGVFLKKKYSGTVPMGIPTVDNF